jgi:hypothetical protein|tara:strand:- start:4356 stop:4586 length:231 start_codon:yes stop_codon:yes gene_type:complete
MKLTPIAANQTEVSINDGTQIFFSYRTPVAAYLPSKGYVRTERFWSKTTSRHINKWLQGVNNVSEVSQTVLDNLAA